jgi:DNA-binding winged helix-turn-helix (wHTH) protein/tetratricopeptide (TPR) repeat protein
MNNGTKHLYEFGPYRLDPGRRLLLRDGDPVAITSKAFEILLILVEHSEQVVLKDELMKELWPNTFVEEANLTQHISMVRKALGETPQDHRYIVTSPGKGYCFTAGVRVISQNGADPVLGNGSISRAVIEQTEEIPAQATPECRVPDNGRLVRPGKRSPRFRWIAAGIAMIVAIGLLAGGLWLFYPRTQLLSKKDLIVVADFANTTGDVMFDETLRQGLAVELEQSPFFNLVTEERVRQVLRMMGQPADAKLTPETAREICERTASAAVLNGTIAPLGSDYVLGLRAVDCRDGRVLDEEQAQAAKKEDVLNALSQIASRFRTRVGESMATIEKYDTPLVDATTPSLEALKAYSLGRKKMATEGNIAARPFYSRAVELDPNFALAYAALSVTYANQREPALAAQNISKAYALRAKVSERERLYIESYYYWIGTGELEKAVPVLEQYQQAYPGYYSPYNILGFIYRVRLGNPQKALEQAREAMRLDPNQALSYYNLGLDYIFLDRLEEAEAVLRQAEERKLENDGIPKARYVLAFLKGDTARMAQAASAAVGKRGQEDEIIAAQADTEAWYGRLKNARELKHRVMDSALHNNDKEAAAFAEAEGALLEAAAGNLKLARADVNSALKLAPDRNVREATALVMARTGDTAAAEKLAAVLDKDFPLDTQVQRYWLPAIRAAIVLERKDPGQAVEFLRVTNAIELGDNRLIVVHLRGEAYLMLHDGSHAAAEFQKFVDHRTLVANSEWGALARLGLARAYSMQGNIEKARTAYQEFLMLWKDADPDLPILLAAKREYVALR